MHFLYLPFVEPDLFDGLIVEKSQVSEKHIIISWFVFLKLRASMSELRRKQPNSRQPQMDQRRAAVRRKICRGFVVVG